IHGRRGSENLDAAAGSRSRAGTESRPDDGAAGAAESAQPGDCDTRSVRAQSVRRQRRRLDHRIPEQHRGKCAFDFPGQDGHVAECRALRIESKRAVVDVLRAKQHVDSLSLDLTNAETSLALVLGLGADDRVRATEEPASFTVPASEEASIEEALETSRELKR